MLSIFSLKEAAWCSGLLQRASGKQTCPTGHVAIPICLSFDLPTRPPPPLLWLQAYKKWDGGSCKPEVSPPDEQGCQQRYYVYVRSGTLIAFWHVGRKLGRGKKKWRQWEVTARERKRMWRAEQMAEISRTQKRKSLTTSAVGGSREATCLLCICPSCPCFCFCCSVFVFVPSAAWTM